MTLTWNVAGFTLHAKRFGRWAITYRVDSPVKHILIADLERLGRHA